MSYSYNMGYTSYMDVCVCVCDIFSFTFLSNLCAYWLRNMVLTLLFYNQAFFFTVPAIKSIRNLARPILTTCSLCLWKETVYK